MSDNEIGWQVLRKEQAVAYGKETAGGFLVRAGSTAMREGSPNVKRYRADRDRLVENGVLVEDDNPALYRFSRDHLFGSRSQAAGVVIDGNSNGSHWTDPISANSASSRLSRDDVEAAMDAFDAWKAKRAFASIFESYGEPRDYWVRSSKERPNPVYPSKPIVGFARKVTDLPGGWRSRDHAAALLHNSGYIVVDLDNEPVDPPERDHLISDADRIRLCALNYYVEAARDRSEAVVTIRAGDLATETGMRDALPNICQALGGEKFQVLARVSPPEVVGPNPGSTTTFTYNLASTRQAVDPVKDEASKRYAMATNLILYGPPGTGKTYHTAFEAVRLCLGDEAAAAVRDDRSALMEAYRKLVSEGRVEFVTFHQSMSYEEFVEGLRPETGSPSGAEPSEGVAQSAGFALRVKDGLFKRISERARLDGGARPDNKGRLDRSVNVYRFGLTGAEWKSKLNKALEAGEVEWLHGGQTDWSAERFEDWDAIKDVRKRENPELRGNSPAVFGTWVIRSAAVDGDLVLLTVGTGKIVAVGRFAGPYKFRAASDTTPASHLRPVDWLWSDQNGVERDTVFPVPFTSFHPIYLIDKAQVAWDVLDTLVFGEVANKPSTEARPHVLIIDEINRANISKVFGELITLLELDKRLGLENEIRLQLPYSKALFGVPANLHIIGTMNTADRSIALLDTALRRRFTFRELMPDLSVLPEVVDGIALRRLLHTLNERIEYLFDREHQIGHAYFTGCRTRADIEDVLRFKVIPLLAEYFYEDWSRVAAVLGC